MILYDKSFQIKGMGERSLQILGFKNIEEFMSERASLDAMVYRHAKDDESISLFENILKSNKRQRVFTIRRKSGQIISIMAKIHDIYMVKGDHAYELDISIADERAEETMSQSLPPLRLPELSTSHTPAPDSATTNIKLDEQWLQKTRFLLDISSEELLAYLSTFTQSALKAEISLQNAALSNDSVSVTRIAKRLAKIATNLHITPLVQTYTSMQTASRNQYARLIQSAQFYLKELVSLINKESL